MTKTEKILLTTAALLMILGGILFNLGFEKLQPISGSHNQAFKDIQCSSPYAISWCLTHAASWRIPVANST